MFAFVYVFIAVCAHAYTHTLSPYGCTHITEYITLHSNCLLFSLSCLADYALYALLLFRCIGKHLQVPYLLSFISLHYSVVFSTHTFRNISK